MDIWGSGCNYCLFRGEEWEWDEGDPLSHLLFRPFYYGLETESVEHIEYPVI